MSAAHWSDALVALGACCEGLAWARTQPDLATAWRTCRRADWMGWLLESGNTAPEPGSAAHRRRVGCAAAIAREVLPIFEAACHADSRVRDCLDVCDRYARGEATVADLAAAGAATGAAAWDASWDASFARSANIIREWYPTPPALEGLSHE